MSPSHTQTLCSNFQSQTVIIMIFRGKIIQRLQISIKILTISELQFRKRKAHTLVYSLSIRSATTLMSQPSPSHWSNCILLSDSSLLRLLNSVTILSEPQYLQKKFLNSCVLPFTAVLYIPLWQKVKRGKRHTFCLQTLPPMKDATGFIQSHTHCPPGCTAANKNAGQTYIIF